MIRVMGIIDLFKNITRDLHTLRRGTLCDVFVCARANARLFEFGSFPTHICVSVSVFNI